MIRVAISAEAYEAVINAPKRPPCIVTYETTPDGEYVVGMVEEIWGQSRGSQRQDLGPQRQARRFHIR